MRQGGVADEIVMCECDVEVSVLTALRTLRKATLEYFSLNSSNLGAMILHGPHHDVE